MRDNEDDAFGYDAVFAVAHALHHMLELQNRTEVSGRELLDVLITKVHFLGVTGLIDFHDASADPDRLYQGDRRAGFSYSLLNYREDMQDLVTTGSWTPCAQGPCGWTERWQLALGVGLTYSTLDNSQPLQSIIVSCPYGAISVDDSMCACDDGFELAPNGEWCQRCEPGQHSLRAQKNFSGSAGCTLCAVDYYRTHPQHHASDCMPCSAIWGVSCHSNATTETLFLQEGYWRLSALSLEVIKCTWRMPCKGGINAGLKGAGYCIDGHFGPRCERCTHSSYYFTQGNCVECPPSKADSRS